MKRRMGFTLIELLVVIAIIAILAAILFPVFAQAREKARAIDCESNLKQTSLGMLQYTQDFDENFPIGNDGVPVQDGGWNSHNVYRVPVSSATAAQLGRATDFWANSIQPYIKSYAAYQCKDSQTWNPYALTDNTPNVTYTYNGELQTSSQAAILSPSAVPMVWPGELGNKIYGYATTDPVLNCGTATQPCVYEPALSGGGCSSANSGNGSTSSPVIFGGEPSYKMYIHASGDNFCYCDGHVKYVNYTITADHHPAGAPAGSPFIPADSAGDLIAPGGNSYGYFYDGCHVYGFEPDFNP